MVQGCERNQNGTLYSAGGIASEPTYYVTQLYHFCVFIQRIPS